MWAAMGFVRRVRAMVSNGKIYLVYHNPKYVPIAQIEGPTSSGEAASHDHPFQPFFLCSISRYLKDDASNPSDIFHGSCFHEYIFSAEQREEEKNHSILPLFWCNNKEFDDDGGCFACRGSNFGTDYYLCVNHDAIFHKECVESAASINHPYHPQHSLKLFYHLGGPPAVCFCCGREAHGQVFKCTICDAFMHTVCAMKPILFVVEQPKVHDHPLTLFPRQTSLTCNVCGVVRELYPTFICARCNFVAHNDCMYSPHIIRISRHPHRISYSSSLLSGEWSCGVCHQNIDNDYGSYTCKYGDYAVHSRCALGKNVWDGKELEGVPEEDDITQIPFDTISKGRIHHFLHDHHLLLEVNILNDENKVCQACAIPIYQGNVYSCMKCDFILHEMCAYGPPSLHHALHPHPLTLKAATRNVSRYFTCKVCDRQCNGFVYECDIEKCVFNLDVRCASISEPFDYRGHEHSLFLASGPKEKLICRMCKSESSTPLICINCDFILCIECATLPYEARYKHDRHYLTIVWGEKVCEKDWCDVCERNLGDTDTKMVYRCNECSTSLHIKCLLGEDPYMKPGQYKHYDIEVQILCQSHVSRPKCDNCTNRCQGKIHKIGNITACSLKCVNSYNVSYVVSL